MVMGADSCLFECANPNQQLSRPMTSTSPGAAVDDLGKRLHAALLSSRPTGSFRPTPPPRLLHHILGRARAPSPPGMRIRLARGLAGILINAQSPPTKIARSALAGFASSDSNPKTNSAKALVMRAVQSHPSSKPRPSPEPISSAQES